MSIMVKKFGGTSVADNTCIERVADTIIRDRQKGNQIVVVVSAQGDTTDDLLAKARELNAAPPPREMDMLLACGEQISASLLAMTLNAKGTPAVSLTGWQAGMQTDANHMTARIKKIDEDRVQEELGRGNVVVVAGFQGINKRDDITTIGRGGSDTTAVAFAAALGADICQIYTDVDGVYSADPRIVPDAVKLPEIGFDEMLELASLGAGVLHNRSVIMAKRYNVVLEVLSSYRDVPGTQVKEVVSLEKTQISGVARDDASARIAVVGLADTPGVASRIFKLLATEKIDVDVILQSIGRDKKKDISFTVNKDHLAKAVAALEAHKSALGFTEVETEDAISKVSIVGEGMVGSPGIAAKMFETLSDADINIQMISTSEIKISVLIAQADSERAVKVLHRAFFG